MLGSDNLIIWEDSILILLQFSKKVRKSFYQLALFHK